MLARLVAMAPVPVVLTTVTLAWVLAGSATAGRAIQPETSGRTVWDGVYSAAQAERGRRNYDASCSSCHQPGLTGAGEAPPLSGARFMQGWREDTLGSLFTRIRTLMPFDDPATLSDDTYIDIMAYILQVNSFPDGQDELKAEGLEGIKIVAKDGPGTVPSFALVQAVGCLTQNGDQTWSLTNSTEPVRTSDPAKSGGDGLKALETTPLGTETLRLLSVYPNPEPSKGHKVEVKGLLIRMPNETRINVSSWQSVAASCAP